MKELIKNCIKVFNRNYISLWGRPVYAEDVFQYSYNECYEDVAIIVQGGIYDKYDFTYETVKLYNKHYPNSKIIISTWDDTQQVVLDKFKECGAIVITNKKPEKFMGNGALQIKSTFEGIKMAEQLGCRYVCKTRSDQRMYATDIFSYLLKLLELFPIKEECLAKERIIALGSNTFSNRLYDVNDMWLFGTTQDMLAYWSCPYEGEEDKSEAYNNIIESYICSEYLKKIGHKLMNNSEDSLYCYIHYFVIIDIQSIDLYFVKRTKEYFNKSYKKGQNIEFAFRNWLMFQ